MQHLIRLTVIFCLAYLFCPSAKAQIRPDQSLANERSIVIPNQTIKNLPSELITGGAIRGENLFHSFKDFNVNAGRGLYFVNPDGIANIFSRVTGNNLSRIEGILGVLGPANLFLLNPQGILFGANARIDLNGSFLATTAEEIIFPSGFSFNARNPQPVPLIKVSAPVGLGFNDNPGSIRVRGAGHNLSVDVVSNILPTPILGAGISPTGLRVSRGNNIALIGGNIYLEGGIITAPEGKIELGSVKTGQVHLNLANWNFDYSDVQKFQNIQLTDRALLDASGLFNGKISLQGSHIVLNNGSFVLIQSQAGNSGKIFGQIQINASESLSVLGQTTDLPSNRSSQKAFEGISSIATVNFSGQGAALEISTADLTIESGSNISTTSFLSGKGGNISINATNSLQVIGASPIETSIFFSNINANSLGASQSGNIKIFTQELLLQDGGSILSTTFGTGKGGDISINASSSISLEGTRNFLRRASVPSSLFSSSFGAGEAGNLTINSPQLTIADGGSVSTSTVGSGDAGEITINASKFVKVSGFIDVVGAEGLRRFPSLITSAGFVFDPLLQEALGLSLSATGDAKNIQINTGELIIENGASISVQNEGSGNGGALFIDANRIRLDNQSRITAATASGEGGNITIHSSDIRLTGGSEISATAGGTGNGGNILINTDTLLMLDASQITANALYGQGGNIQINASAVLASPDSEITASSQLGVDGVVEINTPEENLQGALVPLSVDIILPEDVLEGSCLAQNRTWSEGVFVNAGRGGIPTAPDVNVEEPSLVSVDDRQQPSAASHSPVTVGITLTEFQPWQPGMPMIRANKIVQLPDGRIVSVAEVPMEAAQVDELLCD